MRIIGNDPSVPRQTQEIASGTLPNGKPVVVNADGTVSVVETISDSASTGVAFNSGGADFSNITFDSNSNKVVVAYADAGNSNYGTAIVGTVSGTSITFGSEVVFKTATVSYTDLTFDSNSNKVVIAWRDNTNSGRGTAIVGTVSGDSISFGSAVVFETSEAYYETITFDSNSNKVVIAYNLPFSTESKAVVGTVSGTSISFGTSVVVNSNDTSEFGLVFDTSNNKIVIAYRDDGDSNKGKAKVGTVSGTSISFGSEAEFNSGNTRKIGAAFDSNANKVVIAYRDGGNSNYGTAIVGTVSGTSISFGSEVVFDSSYVNDNQCVFNSSANKVIISYYDTVSPAGGKIIVGTVSGTSISFGTAVTFESSSISYPNSVYDSSADRVVVVYSQSGGNGEYTVFITGSANLTSENYIGIARSGAADTAGAIIDTQGAIADIPTINYNLDLGSYDNKNFNVGSNINDIAINNDGTKIYYVIDGGSAVQRTLSTAFDISTAGSATSYNATGQDNDPRDVTFKTDGTKMYITASQNNKIYQYSLSSAFDVTSASYDSKSVSAAVGLPYSTQFKSDGTKMYVAEASSGTYYIVEYTLSTPWDVSTASYTSNSFNVSSQSNAVTGLFLRPDGTEIFGASQNDRTIYKWNFGTAFDVSTISYSNTSFNVSTQVGGSNSIKGVMFSSDGDKMYVGGVFATDTIYQYSTTSAFTPAQSYFVQTNGTLSTTADDPSVFAGTAVSATKLIVKG